ncbi:hypothetical protein LZ32DRAFT_238594 [Colletotrichum eremochloae]|nr:hypothetical protein LZ32DRAFT_238594 [Colletotrichum eremochloae]
MAGWQGLEGMVGLRDSRVQYLHCVHSISDKVLDVRPTTNAFPTFNSRCVLPWNRLRITLTLFNVCTNTRTGDREGRRRCIVYWTQYFTDFVKSKSGEPCWLTLTDPWGFTPQQIGHGKRDVSKEATCHRFLMDGPIAPSLISLASIVSRLEVVLQEANGLSKTLHGLDPGQETWVLGSVS